jgi:hypothetical protein
MNWSNRRKFRGRQAQRIKTAAGVAATIAFGCFLWYQYGAQYAAVLWCVEWLAESFAHTQTWVLRRKTRISALKNRVQYHRVKSRAVAWALAEFGTTITWVKPEKAEPVEEWPDDLDG